MKYLFINSMSRTGTSLLYQLLYGHSSIYFAPFRIQLACAKPFSFPLDSKDFGYNKAEFFKTLLAKTTIVENQGIWPNITTNNLANLFPNATANDIIEGANALETAIKTVHNILQIPLPNTEYYCLHDDHSYMLGAQCFCQYENSKILTTIRNPFDMIASKKNMLTMYVYGQQDPEQFDLKEEVLYKETMRACFSWWAASYENKVALPILFNLLKPAQTRKEVLESIMQYLGLNYEEILLDEKTPLDNAKYHNELLANGSSLNTIAYLTQGKKNDNTKARNMSINTQEMEILNSIIDKDIFENLASNFDYFNQHFKDFCLDFSMKDFVFTDSVKKPNEIFENWKALYKNQQFTELFMQYSNFNYGNVNAKEAFKVDNNSIEGETMESEYNTSSVSGGGGKICY